jgi:hypothetical protein
MNQTFTRRLKKAKLVDMRGRAAWRATGLRGLPIGEVAFLNNRMRNCQGSTAGGNGGVANCRVPALLGSSAHGLAVADGLGPGIEPEGPLPQSSSPAVFGPLGVSSCESVAAQRRAWRTPLHARGMFGAELAPFGGRVRERLADSCVCGALEVEVLGCF